MTPGAPLQHLCPDHCPGVSGPSGKRILGAGRWQGTKAGRRWLVRRRPTCPITSARSTTARTATDGCSVATTSAASSSCTKPTSLPAERRLKSRSVTFSEEARRDPSIKRSSALSATSSIPDPGGLGQFEKTRRRGGRLCLAARPQSISRIRPSSKLAW